MTFKVGDKIKHATLGAGTVTLIGNQCIEIRLDSGATWSVPSEVTDAVLERVLERADGHAVEPYGMLGELNKIKGEVTLEVPWRKMAYGARDTWIRVHSVTIKRLMELLGQGRAMTFMGIPTGSGTRVRRLVERTLEEYPASGPEAPGEMSAPGQVGDWLEGILAVRKQYLLESKSNDQRAHMTTESTTDWRSLTPDAQADFMTWFLRHSAARQEKGIGKYGRTFQGDPLDHLIEELLDALFYAWMEKRRREGE